MVFSAPMHLFPVFLTPVLLQLFSFITMTFCLSCNTFGTRFQYDQQLRVIFLLQGLNQSVENAGVHLSRKPMKEITTLKTINEQ